MTYARAARDAAFCLGGREVGLHPKIRGTFLFWAKPPQNPNFQMLQMLFTVCVPNRDENSTPVNIRLDNNHFTSHG